MRRDRYGERVDDHDDQPDTNRPQQAAQPPPHHCDTGWIDRNADKPVPCLICRPHLGHDRRRAELHIPPQRPGDHERGSARVRGALAEARERRRTTTP
ncbi:hypothetical protein [Saccharothrix deserti]|uniref:hypothetical protein n=1 Tax=Saccharothrix deserti TaxID=2593674 RepID=UPI00131EA69C|nr:hypothetical protein [Saccharothrix deserti]